MPNDIMVEIPGWPHIGKGVYQGNDAWVMSAVFIACSIAWFWVADDPQSAILIPVTLFVVGVLMALVEVRHRAKVAEVARNTKAKGERWQWEHPWNRTEALDRNARSWRSIAIYLVIFDIISVLMLLSFAKMGGEDGRQATLFWGGLAALLNAVAIARLSYHLARRSKFGVSSLRLAEFPFRRGSEVRVVLRNPRWLHEAQSVKATLRCIHETIEERGIGSKKTPEIVSYCMYEDAQELQPDACRRHALTGLPLEFNVPLDVPVTKLVPNPPTYWDLEVKAEMRGVDYHAHFLIPLY